MNKLVAILRTKGGQVAKVIFLLGVATASPTAANVLALRDALEALCTTSTQRCALVAVAGFSDSVTVSDLNNVQDKMVLWFKTADGAKVSYRIPGPKTACFQPNSDIVNKGDAQVLALIGLIKTHCKARNGAAITDYISGRRLRMKNSQAGYQGTTKP